MLAFAPGPESVVPRVADLVAEVQELLDECPRLGQGGGDLEPAVALLKEAPRLYPCISRASWWFPAGTSVFEVRSQDGANESASQPGERSLKQLYHQGVTRLDLGLRRTLSWRFAPTQLPRL